MSHADDGLIHAYLDGVLERGDPAAVALLSHIDSCEACRVRLEGARALKQRADDVLGLAAPHQAETPPFDAVLARAGRTRAAGEAVRARRPLWTRVPFAWAASLTLALAAGWLARDMFIRYGARGEPIVTREAASAPQPAGADFARDQILPERQEAAADARDLRAGAASADEAAAEQRVEELGRASTEPPVGAVLAVPPPAPPGEAVEKTAGAALRSSASEPGLAAVNALEDAALAVVVLHERDEVVPSDPDAGARAEIAEPPRQRVAPAWSQRLLLAIAAANEAGGWAPVAPEQAVARLGAAPAFVPDLAAQSYEIADANGLLLVRMFLDLGAGETVELVQLAPSTGAELEIDAARALAQAQTFEGNRADARALDMLELDLPPGLPWPHAAADSLFGGRALVAVDGTTIKAILIAPVPADSLAALARRVR